MTGTETRKDPLRHRLYFRLMDASLFFAGLGLLDWFVDPFERGEYPAWYIVLGSITLAFNGLVPLFLMVAKFMRDEYAEGLWRRSLVVIAYGMAIVPPILLLAPWAMYLLLAGDASARPDWDVAFQKALYDNEVKPYFVIGKVWLTFMLMFVGVFQFLRWKDSR